MQSIPLTNPVVRMPRSCFPFIRSKISVIYTCAFEGSELNLFLSLLAISKQIPACFYSRMSSIVQDLIRKKLHDNTVERFQNSSVGSYIHTLFALPPFSDFLLLGVHQPRAWKKCFLSVNQLLWFPLLSNSPAYGIHPSRSLKKSKLAYLAILPIAFLLPHKILNSTILLISAS